MDYALITSQNVRRLVELRGMSIRALAEAVQLSPSTLVDALKSKKGIPIDPLMRIADYFGVGIGDLCRADFEAKVQPETRGEKLVRSYHRLDAHGKEIIDFIFEKELERCGSRL